MRKILFLMLLLFLAGACNKTDGTESDSTSTDDVTTPITDGTDNTTEPPPADNTTSVPTPAETFSVNITLINFTASQEEKMMKAVELVKRLVASEEFRTRILDHAYKGAKTYVDNDGMANEEIYQKILDGDETLRPTKDNEMDVEVELYYENTTTVGYTYASSKRIWVNTKYFDKYSTASVAANLMHEWLHKLGFSHAVSYSVSRDYSVPYGIGGIVRDIGPDYY